MPIHRRRAAPMLLAIACLIGGIGRAEAAQKLVPAQSEIAFVSKQMGSQIPGKFEKFDGQISVDVAKPETGKVSFTVDLASAAIGSPDTLTELKKPEWFDTGKTPTATFQSTSIKAAGPGKIEVAGKLTIKGVTRDVVVPMTLTQQGDVLKASGEFTIKRLDYKIGAGEWGDTSLVANEVLVKPRLTVQGTP